MIFRVPIMYEIEAVPHGRRKPVKETAFEWIEVEVEEADAPVATEWRDTDGHVRRTAWHRESHWLQHRIRMNEEEAILMTAEVLATACAEGGKHGNPLPVGIDRMLREFARGERPEFDPSAYRQIVSSGREQAVETAHANAARTLVSDGAVWIRCKEPVYVLRPPRMERKGEPAVLRPIAITLDTRDDRMPLSDIFRADRWDDMVQEAVARWEVEDAPFTADGEARIAVLVPESIRYDDERAALLGSVEVALEERRRSLPSMSLRQVRAWLEASEALESARAAWTEETAAALEATAAIWVDVTFAEERYWPLKMKQAVDRWRARPIGHEAESQEPTMGGF